jgi:hypothetical protein
VYTAVVGALVPGHKESQYSAFMLGRLPCCNCADVGVISVFITTLRNSALPRSCCSSYNGASSVYTSCLPLALLLHICSLVSVLATFTTYITSHNSFSTTCLHYRQTSALVVTLEHCNNHTFSEGRLVRTGAASSMLLGTG